MTRRLTFRDAVNEALRQEMERDPSVILLGEDIAGGAGAPGARDAWGGIFGVTKGLQPLFPGRVLDTPITESAFVGAAVGAALAGQRPVVELMFNDFMGVCFDPIVNQAAKMRYMLGGRAGVPLVIRTAFGAGFRSAAQHSQSLYALLTHVPGLKCVVPSNATDAKGLLIEAIRDDDPVVFFEHRKLYDLDAEVTEEPYTVPLGRARVVRRGGDLTVVTLGAMVAVALAAATTLAAEGIECEVIDLRTTSPLDEGRILESVHATGRLVVVDEAPPRCGIASDISAIVAERAFASLRAPIARVTAPHCPVPFSPVLEDLYLPNEDDVANAARDVVLIR